PMSLKNFFINLIVNSIYLNSFGKLICSFSNSENLLQAKKTLLIISSYLKEFISFNKLNITDNSAFCLTFFNSLFNVSFCISVNFREDFKSIALFIVSLFSPIQIILEVLLIIIFLYFSFSE